MGLGRAYRSLNATERTAYLRALDTSHRTNVSSFVYDADETLIGTLEGNVIGGQIDCDSNATITRTLSLSLEDPAVKFVFDPIGPIYADKFIQVIYSVDVASIGWVDVPVFYGSVSRYTRDGHDVTIEAVGKEALMLPPTVPNTPPYDIYGRFVGFLRTTAAAHGETRFRLGDAGQLISTAESNATLDAAKADGHSIWGELVALCRDRNFQLFYDPEGYLCLRRWPKNSTAHTFTGVANEPSVGFDLTLVRNKVHVYGTDKKTSKDVLKATAFLAASHPLSSASLARGGISRVLLENVKTGRANLTTAEAVDIADRTLRHMSDVMLDVSFDSLVLPHLELGDMARLKTDTIDATFALNKFSIPLGADALMSVGRIKRLGLARYRRRFRR